MLVWSSRASAAFEIVDSRRPVRLSTTNTLLSRLPRMMLPSAVRLGAASTSSGSEMGRRWVGRGAQGRQAGTGAGQAAQRTSGRRLQLLLLLLGCAAAVQSQPQLPPLLLSRRVQSSRREALSHRAAAPPGQG